MKKSIIAIACVLALGLTGVTASASPVTLAYNDIYYLGSIDPGNGQPADEILWINKLASLAPSGTYTFVNPGQDDVVTRSANVFGVILPTVSFGVKNDNSTQPAGGIDVTAYYYLLGKFGGSSHVWVVDALTLVYLPDPVEYPFASGGGLSHYSKYGESTTTVPDGGMTLMLLGGALVGIGALRRKFRA